MSTEVLQITMAWERKRKQAEADLRDQLNEAEDTITEMGDKVCGRRRVLGRLCPMQVVVGLTGVSLLQRLYRSRD